jgi:hypothetical protein
VTRTLLTPTAAALVLLVASGCGTKPPPLHPVSGKVTVKGKGYERTLIYFRPVSGEVSMYNMGVAETDKTGQFKSVMSAGGDGLQAGEYKVTFSCVQTKGGKAVGGVGEKPDESGITTVELVGKPYDTGSEADTPVRYTVTAGGDNTFNFDIPTAAK